MATKRIDTDSLNSIFEIETTNNIQDAEELSPGNMQLPPGVRANDVNVNRIYEDLEKLTTDGASILQSAREIMETADDVEGIAGVASVMNSLRSVVHEFNAINMQNIKHQQALELEERKLQNKIKLEKERAALKNTTNVDPLSGGITPNNSGLPSNKVVYNTEDTIKRIVHHLKETGLRKSED